MRATDSATMMLLHVEHPAGIVNAWQVSGLQQFKTMNSKVGPGEGSEDWSWNAVLIALKRAGWPSQRKFAEVHGIHLESFRNTRLQPAPHMEQIIAQALGTVPEKIWPSRYSTEPYRRTEAQPLRRVRTQTVFSRQQLAALALDLANVGVRRHTIVTLTLALRGNAKLPFVHGSSDPKRMQHVLRAADRVKPSSSEREAVAKEIGFDPWAVCPDSHGPVAALQVDVLKSVREVLRQHRVPARLAIPVLFRLARVPFATWCREQGRAVQPVRRYMTANDAFPPALLMPARNALGIELW